MKKDPIVKSGLQNLDDNSKDEQIHSTKDAWKDLEELFSEDPKKGSIFLGYIDYTVNFGMRFGLFSDSSSINEWYTTCKNLYSRGCVDFDSFRRYLGGALQERIKGVDRFKRLADFDALYGFSVFEAVRKYHDFLERNPIAKIDPKLFSSKIKEEKEVERLSFDINAVVYINIEKRSYFGVSYNDILKDNISFLSLLDYINKKGYELFDISFHIEKKREEPITFRLKESSFMKSFFKRFVSFYELQFLSNPNETNYEETIEKLKKNPVTDTGISKSLEFELVSGIYDVFVKYGLVRENATNNSISFWIFKLLGEIANIHLNYEEDDLTDDLPNDKKEYKNNGLDKKEAADVIRFILKRRSNRPIPPVPFEFRTIWTKARVFHSSTETKVREHDSYDKYLMIDVNKIMSRVGAIKILSDVIFDDIERNIQLAKNSNEAYDENNKKIPCSDLNVAASLRVRFHRDFDSLYLMEDEWLLDIEDRLNSLQDPTEELYRDVSDKIQIFHHNTKDIVELCIKPSDGDQQLIPEYTQLYEKLNMSYEQLKTSYEQLKKTIRETRVRPVSKKEKKVDDLMSLVESIKRLSDVIFDDIERNIQLAKNSNEAYDENNKKIPCSDLNVAASLRVRFNIVGLYFMENKWLPEIENKLNLLLNLFQDPIEEPYHDVFDKIQNYKQVIQDVIKLFKKPSDGDQQLIPKYKQLYERLNMSYEQLIMSYMQIEKTNKETNVQEVDVQKEGIELLFSRKDIMSVFQPELWALVKQRIKE